MRKFVVVSRARRRTDPSALLDLRKLFAKQRMRPAIEWSLAGPVCSSDVVAVTAFALVSASPRAGRVLISSGRLRTAARSSCSPLRLIPDAFANGSSRSNDHRHSVTGLLVAILAMAIAARTSTAASCVSVSVIRRSSRVRRDPALRRSVVILARAVDCGRQSQYAPELTMIHEAGPRYSAPTWPQHSGE